MGEGGRDFLDVMGHENERGPAGLARERFKEEQELFAGHRIEARAGFVEDQQAGTGDQGAGDQNALAFPLRKIGPFARGEMRAADEPQPAAPGRELGPRRVGPEVELGVASAHHGLERRLGRRDRGLQGARDQADVQPQFAPVGFAVAPAEHRDGAGRRRKVTGQGLEQGGLPAAV